MYLEFFKLWDEPFGVTPDPAYLYPSQTHLHALNALRTGILDGRGFMTLIAEPGMGKTTLLYQLIEQLPQTTRSAYIFQTQCNSLEFMQYLLSEIGVDPNGLGLVAMHRRLNDMLFNEMVQGKQFVLIVDESQNLSNAVLETIRLLSNFETAHSKLLQIVLTGQPDLANKLRQPDLAQLLQRVTVMASLDAFSFEETAAYIRHRLKLAGHTGTDLFDPAALAAVFRRSKGIPRNINRVCHAALSQAQEEQAYLVTAAMVEKANRGLGPTNEELQRARFASQPRAGAAAPAAGASAGVTADVASAPAAAQRQTQAPPVGQPSAPSVAPPIAPRVAHARSQSQRPAVEPPAEPPTPSAAPSFSDAPYPSEAAPVAARTNLPPHLPDFVPPPPPARSYRWLLWTVALVAVVISGALAAPNNVRQAFLEKLGFAPIVGSASSIDDVQPSSSGPAKTLPNAGGRTTASSAPPVGGVAKSDVPVKHIKIVIDPGHGGTDPGARGPYGLLEKSVCLEVALRLGGLIEDNLPGSEVIYTRNEDQSVSPQRRATTANESSADLFISIHAGQAGEGQGLQMYYAGGGTEKRSVGPANNRGAGQISLQLASDVQKALAQQFKSKTNDAPVRAPAQPEFAVLNGVEAPAVVAEIPFSDNDSPLVDPNERQKLADAIFRGIADFVKTLPARTAQ